MKNGLGIPLMFVPRDRFYSLRDLRRDKRRVYVFHSWFEKTMRANINSMSNYKSFILNHFSV